MRVYLIDKTVNAKGEYNFDDNSLTVLKGSTYESDIASYEYNLRYKDLHKELLDKQVISDNQFLTDYKFSSPSAAASVVLGRQKKGLHYWKNNDGISLRSLLNRNQFLDYFNKNIVERNKEISEYIKICNETVKRVQSMHPLESLENLPIEKWDLRSSRESLTYLIERGTNDMLSGFLGTNQNKLIYQTKDLSYAATNNIINITEGNTIEEKYKNFIKGIYNSIVRYNDEDYLANRNEYTLVGANVLFTKLLSFYRPESILLMASPTFFLRIFEHLQLGKFENDSMIANIIWLN